MDRDENILSPEQAELAFSRIEWGFDENGEYYENEEKIPSRTCTDLDLGWTTEGSDDAVSPQFYPMSEKVKEQVEAYRNHF